MKNKMITFILSLIIIYTAVGINANADISSPEDVKDWEVIFGVTEPTRTPYEQSNSAINRRFCYNESKSYSSIWRVALFL